MNSTDAETSARYDAPLKAVRKFNFVFPKNPLFSENLKTLSKRLTIEVPDRLLQELDDAYSQDGWMAISDYLMNFDEKEFDNFEALYRYELKGVLYELASLSHESMANRKKER